jgi:hypothetical protein
VSEGADFIRNQLVAMQAQLAAMQITVGTCIQMLMDTEEEEPEYASEADKMAALRKVCAHPDGEKADTGTFGNERWKCGICGIEFDESKGGFINEGSK